MARKLAMSLLIVLTSIFVLQSCSIEERACDEVTIEDYDIASVNFKIEIGAFATPQNTNEDAFFNNLDDFKFYECFMPSDSLYHYAIETFQEYEEAKEEEKEMIEQGYEDAYIVGYYKDSVQLVTNAEQIKDLIDEACY